MAKYRNGFTDEITLYIMEPEEELVSLRFQAIHSPNTTDVEWWKLGPSPNMTTEEQAQWLKLEGGYKYNSGGIHS